MVRRYTTALIEAEEQGITQANVEEMRKSPSPSVQRLLGVTAGAAPEQRLQRPQVKRNLPRDKKDDETMED